MEREHNERDNKILFATQSIKYSHYHVNEENYLDILYAVYSSRTRTKFVKDFMGLQLEIK